MSPTLVFALHVSSSLQCNFLTDRLSCPLLPFSSLLHGPRLVLVSPYQMVVFFSPYRTISTVSSSLFSTSSVVVLLSRSVIVCRFLSLSRMHIDPFPPVCLKHDVMFFLISCLSSFFLHSFVLSSTPRHFFSRPFPHSPILQCTDHTTYIVLAADYSFENQIRLSSELTKALNSVEPSSSSSSSSPSSSSSSSSPSSSSPFSPLTQGLVASLLLLFSSLHPQEVVVCGQGCGGILSHLVTLAMLRTNTYAPVPDSFADSFTVQALPTRSDGQKLLLSVAMDAPLSKQTNELLASDAHAFSRHFRLVDGKTNGKQRHKAVVAGKMPSVLSTSLSCLH